jgi:hypothetical protein
MYYKNRTFLSKNKEFFGVISYLIISIILVYYIPAPANKLIFLLALPLAWISKKDYLWLVFFFVLEDTPGGLFSGGWASDAYRLPIYTIATNISFTIRELYLFLIFVKVLYKDEYKNGIQTNFFSRELKLAGYYLFFLLIISTLIGMSINAYRDFYKICIGLTLFVSVPKILSDRSHFISFFRILFPFALIAILLQIYSLTTGQQLIALFKPGVTSIQGIVNATGEPGKWQRPIEMIHVLLACFTGSLFMLNKKPKEFKPAYLITINLLSFLGIFLTGTRSWFIALIVLYIFLLISWINHLSYSFIRNLLVAFFLIIAVTMVPVINRQISGAWDRLSTLEKITEGDITAGGTSSRFDIRAPRVMEGFNKSTLISGAGFTQLYYNYCDGHIGYHNMLLNSGIIGMLIFGLILFKALYVPFDLSLSRKLSLQSRYELRASCLLVISLIVINTGTQMLGYTLDSSNRFFLMTLALVFINQAANSALKEI